MSLPNPPPTASYLSANNNNAFANENSSNKAANPDASAATKLAEAIDTFLGDLETKFQGISDEILTKLDDMAERCDRLEAELLVNEAVGAEGTGPGNGRNEEGGAP